MNKRIKSALTKVTFFYAAVSIVLYIGIQFDPEIFRLLPTGATERLHADDGLMEINAVTIPSRIRTDDYEKQGFFLLTSFLSALLLAIPVGTTYLAICVQKQRSASLVKLIVILPVTVTGLVLIVQNSLALAFSLAGIVAGAGIRFRANMREYTDAVFFLTSIGIGLSAGIGAIGVALVMSIVFCYTVLVIFAIDYGGENIRATSKVPAGGKVVQIKKD